MRRPRLALPGVPLHITQRGVNRAAVFLDDEDCAAYLQALQTAAQCAKTFRKNVPGSISCASGHEGAGSISDWAKKGAAMRRHLVMSTMLLLVGCSAPQQEAQQRPEQAGQPMDPVKTAARMASIRGAALMGDQAAVQANMKAMQEDYRKAIKLADPARRVDRETARAAAKSIDGVRSAVWLDHENLFAIVATNAHRSYATIDAICMALEPLGDTLGVVVNLQSGAATTGDDLEILSQNCQLAPGDRAFMQRQRRVDVIPPEIRAQQKAARADLERTAREREAQAAESLRILEASTPEM